MPRQHHVAHALLAHLRGEAPRARTPCARACAWRDRQPAEAVGYLGARRAPPAEPVVGPHSVASGPSRAGASATRFSRTAAPRPRSATRPLPSESGNASLDRDGGGRSSVSPDRSRSGPRPRAAWCTFAAGNSVRALGQRPRAETGRRQASRGRPKRNGLPEGIPDSAGKPSSGPDRNLRRWSSCALTEGGPALGGGAAGRPWGAKEAADQAAVDGMRHMLALGEHGRGGSVIGEGEKDEAPMLYKRRAHR